MSFTTTLQLILPSFFFSFVLTICAKLIATHLGFVDSPDTTRKKHAVPTPVLGGAAMTVALWLGLFTSYCFSQLMQETFSTNSYYIITVVVVASMYCLLGTLDDRYELRPLTKLFGQLLCALPFVLLQMQVSEIQFLNMSFSAQWAWPVFSLFWIILCVNAFNLIDGVDGLAGTLATVTIISISVLAFGQSNTQVVLVAIVAAGTTLGFLVHNIPPAKIFMGDGGSMMLGFLVAVLSISAATSPTGTFYLIVPIVLLGVPLLDTCLAILRRMLRGKSWRAADRDHIHHRLLDRGFTHGEVVVALGSVNLLFSAAALYTFGRGSDIAVLFFATLTFAVLVSTRIIGELEVSLVRKFFSRNTILAERDFNKTVDAEIITLEASPPQEHLLDVPSHKLAECGIEKIMVSILSSVNEKENDTQPLIFIAFSQGHERDVNLQKVRRLIYENQDQLPEPFYDVIAIETQKQIDGSRPRLRRAA